MNFFPAIKKEIPFGSGWRSRRRFYCRYLFANFRAIAPNGCFRSKSWLSKRAIPVVHVDRWQIGKPKGKSMLIYDNLSILYYFLLRLNTEVFRAFLRAINKIQLTILQCTSPIEALFPLPLPLPNSCTRSNAAIFFAFFFLSFLICIHRHYVCKYVFDCCMHRA